ncbi:MAG TPA: VOC family protein [Gemmatimonadales bacterium]|nr:VOC family protein [Gemmatimonadales bacterium]
MLADRDAIATVAVKDMEVAKRFYEGTLGLKPAGADSGPSQPLSNADVRVYRSGKTNFLVYKSQYAGTNKANAVTWGLGDDLERVVQSLQAKGVVFEHYDLPGLTRKGDVHQFGTFRAAWFKDPDGNILHINSG